MIKKLLLLIFFLSICLYAKADKLYWVGGYGNFNDPAHWSYTSGGNGGAKTPDLIDDVYFDQNSSLSTFIVKILGEVKVHDFIISERMNTLILEGSSSSGLIVSGNLNLKGNINWQMEGKLNFIANNPSIVDFGNVTPKNDVIFNGASTWNLKSNLITINEASIILKRGKLILNNTAISTKNLFKHGNDNFEIELNDALISVKEIVSTNSSLRISQQESQLFFPLNRNGFDELNRQHLDNLKLIDNYAIQSLPVTVTNITNCVCNGQCNGTATVTFSGAGSGPYTIQWLSATPNTFSSVAASPFLCTGLCANTYVVRVIGATGTIVQTANVVISQPSQIVIGITNTAVPLCNGDCNGKIVYYVIGGNPNYTVSWNPGNIIHTGLQQSFDDSITALCSGTYTITINDSKGCTGTDNVPLLQPNPLVANPGNTNQQCFGECNSSAWLAPSGGTPFGATQSNGINYLVSWNGNPALSNDSIVNLCPGANTYVITDANNCTLPGSITVASKTDFTYTKSTPSNLLCNDVCDGSANITAVSGATPPYTFAWLGSGTPSLTNTATTSTATALCSGTYSVVIIDALGCDDTTTFNLTAPATLVGTVSKTNVSCAGGSNGTATGSQTGGAGTSFTYSWFNSTTNPVAAGVPFSTANPTVNNLTAGNYTLVIVDQNGCNDSVSFQITEPLPFTVTATKTNPTCFGLNNGQVCASTSGGTGVVTYTFLPVGGTVSSNCYNSLVAGTYTVTATDANGCTATTNTTLTSPTQISPNVTRVNPTCSSNCNGTATSVPTGGSGSGYTFAWSCSPTITASITGQCAGACTLTITDGTGCTQNTTVTFVAPNPLTASLTGSGLNCSGASTGQITSSVNGGTPNYSYLWAPGGQTTPGLSGVPAGTYTLTLRDANNCTATSNTTLTSPTAIVITTSSTDPLCFGQATGTITSSASGGTAPYTAQWLPTNSTNFNQNNLAAGSYSLTVTDAFGCTSTKTVTINQPTSLVVNSDSTRATCSGTCNGTATANASGGSTPYSFSWNSTPTQSTQTATALCAGTFIVTITDAQGCQASDLVTVTQPTAVTAVVNNITSSCANVCTGTGQIVCSGGVAPYTFTIDGTSIGSTTNLTTLCPGTHTVTATDANNCSFTTTFVVPSLINITLTTSINQLTCSGDCNGTATASVSGATGTPLFNWQPINQTTQTVNGLCAGNYTVTVTDANGCQATSNVSFVDPPVLSVTDVTLDVDCDGNCTGSSVLTPTGGVSPYTVSWSNGNTGVTISNLCIGSYTATIIDNNGCTLKDTVEVSQPDIFTVTSVTNPPSDCISSDASITVTPIGGSGSFSYNWSPVPGNTATLSGLSAGIFTVTITDLIYGCDTIIPFTISDPTGPTIQLTTIDVTCNGLTNGSATTAVLTSNGAASITYIGGPTGTSPLTYSNLSENNYVVQVTDASNCATFETFTITQPDAINVNQVIEHASCNGATDGSIVLSPSGGTRPFSYTINGAADDSSMTNLSAGPYTIVLTDANSCSSTITQTITEPTSLTATESHTNVNCTTGFGSATITASGGTLPYTYSWTSGAGNVQTVNNLLAGNYTATVTDANLCSFTVAVVITQNADITSGLQKAENTCNNGCTGTALIAPTGGTGNYTIAWSHNSSTQLNQTALCPGNYTVTISDDNGCSLTESYTITAPAVISATSVEVNPSCNGDANGSITITPSGGTPGYSYSWSPNLNTTNAASSLIAGSYTIQITDASACSNSVIVELEEPDGLTVNATPTSPTCFGLCDGSISSSPIGGTSPFTFSWNNDATLGITNSITNLCAADYSIRVTDANGCKDSIQLTLTEPDPVGLTASTGAAICNAVPCNGSITINSIVGNSVLWLNATIPNYTGLSLTDLCAGTYSIQVQDANACKDTVSVEVSNSDGPLVNVDSIDVTCNDLCNGTLTVVQISGNGPFTYSWTDPTLGTDSIANNLCAGNYVSEVTDINGCITVSPISVNEPSPLDDQEIVTDAFCNGVNDGSIVLNPTGGTGTLHYAWSNNPTLDSPSNPNLAPGIYSVTITDDLACSYPFTYTVGSNTNMFYQLVTTQVTCSSICDGSAEISSISGGIAPYTINWSHGVNGQTVSNLCAGDYTVTITDNNGCIQNIDTTIAEPLPLLANETVTNTTCGECQGSIALAPTGGNGTYTYLWANGQTSSTLTNLCAGVYAVDVTDALGCLNQLTLFVNNTDGPVVTISKTDVLCSGQCTGAASANLSGGTAPFTFNWVGLNQFSSAVSNLCAGNYVFQVLDANNCLVNENVEITETSVLNDNAVITPTTCGSANGAVTISPSGGAAPYTLSWSNSLPAQLTQSNLAAGLYTVDITDANSCSETFFITLNSDSGPTVSITTTSVTCNGNTDGSATLSISGPNPPFNVLWSNGSTANPTLTGLVANQYAVTVTDANLCVTVQDFIIDEPTLLSLSFNNIVEPSCPEVCNGSLSALAVGGTLPYSYLWNSGNQTSSTITNLCEGEYVVIATDANGCQVTQTTQVAAGDNPFTIDTTITSPTCNLCDGTIDLSVTGGAGPYNYVWSSGATTEDISSVCAGVYQLTITDNDGCNESYNFPISNAQGITGEVLTTTNETCFESCDGTASVTPVGGTPNYTYLWPHNNANTNSLSGLCAGTYFIQMTDANHCIRTTQVDILSPNELIVTPQVVSPNCNANDGSITLNVSGGTGTLTYVWNPPVAGNTNVATALGAGIYEVSITDSLFCSQSFTITLSDINAPQVNVIDSAISCYGLCDGSIALSITNTNPVTVLWNNNSTDTAITNLCEGTYTALITDAVTGCATAISQEITQPDSLRFGTASVVQPRCDVACNGSITVVAFGGTLPYTYQWNSGASTSNQLTNICPGNYLAILTDANGCQVTQTTQVAAGDNPFTIDTTITSPTCNLCDGTIDLSVTGGVSPYNYVWSSGATTEDISSVCAGVYQLTITDNDGCNETVNFAISNAQGITGEVVSTTNETCFESCDGTASVTPIGGTPNYTYLWPHNNANTNSLTGLCAGTYFIQMTDANHCIRTTQVDILSPNELIVTPQVVSPNCNANDGSITLNISGGTGTLTYVWNPPVAGNTNVATSLGAGVYEVSITDSLLCSQSFTITLSDINAPQVNVIDSSISCYGLCDGNIALIITNTNPVTVLWNNNSTDTAITNLCEGNYTALITDAVTGCATAISQEITQPDSLRFGTASVIEPRCDVACNGSITAVAFGGTLPYTYQWNSGTSTTNELSNICPGNYLAILTDANGCQVTQTTQVAAGDNPFTIDTTIVSPTCNLCDGTIDLSVTGGAGQYNYVWSSGATTEDISSVCAGVYQLTITDNDGCNESYNFPISNAQGITGEVVTTTNETCFESCDGTASVTPIGGTPNYTYLWPHNNANTNSLIGLCAGTYFIQMTDANHCIRTTQVDILSPNKLIVTPQVVSPNCNANDGSITLNVSGGTGTLTYVWNPPVAGNTNVATALGAGIYEVSITDSLFCSQSFTITLSDINAPQVNVIDSAISCYGLCDGSIALSITNTNPVTVLWNNNSTDTAITNLCEGNYTALITDAVTGCATAISQEITQPDSLLLGNPVVLDPKCFGTCTGEINAIAFGGTLPYSYQWQPNSENNSRADSLCSGTYTLTVNDKNFCAVQQTITLVDPPSIISSGVVTNASCSSVPNGAIDVSVSGGIPNYSYQWIEGSTDTTQDLTNVFYGDYTLVITDSIACTDTIQFQIGTVDTVTANAGNDIELCFSQTALLDASASFTNSGSLTYQWSELPAGNSISTNDSANVQPPVGNNSYQLIVANSSGCSDTDTVVVKINALPIVDAGTDVDIIEGETKGLGGNPTSNINGSIFSWLPNLALDNDSVANPVTSTTVTTTYVVTVLDTATGCSNKDSIQVKVTPQIVISNGISPNGDGKNDAWAIDLIYKFPDNEVEIYNRWGELLYYKQRYDNSWNGTFKGKPLPVGTYYYVIKLNDPKYPDPISGPITIFK